MSRARNRNIKQIFNKEPIRSNNVPGIYFGECVSSNGNSNDFEGSNSSIYNIDTADGLRMSKSSSSSLSWAEDCEIEATQKVKYEYEKMNNILSGLEAIPPNYDKDEYKLWIKTFPCLRQTGLTEKGYSQNNTRNSRNKCDNVKFNDTDSIAVINNFLKRIPNLPGEAKIQNTKKRSKIKRKIQESNHNIKDNLQDDFSSILRISPAPTYDKHVSLENKRLSTNYPRRVNILNADSKEYTSLPHLLPQVTENYLTIKNVEITAKRKLKTRQKTNKLVLPPIDVTLNQFRSISAIPLQQNKCSSALSTKTNFFVGYKHSQNVINARLNKNKMNGFY